MWEVVSSVIICARYPSMVMVYETNNNLVKSGAYLQRGNVEKRRRSSSSIVNMTRDDRDVFSRRD